MNDELKEFIDAMAFQFRVASPGIGKKMARKRFKVLYEFANVCEEVKIDTIKYLESRAKDFGIDLKDL